MHFRLFNFTWKEKSQGISVDSTNDGNNCTTKKVNWKQTERQTDLLCEFLQRNTDFNYPLILEIPPVKNECDFSESNSSTSWKVSDKSELALLHSLVRGPVQSVFL